MDGALDEAPWRTAVPIGPLVQREPREGEPASEATDVRVLVTPDALYFGIVCHDRQPSRIVAAKLARDAELEADDSVMIVVDPFFDQRNGFFFEVNPAGARSDGQVSNNAEQIDRDWDGIWNAAARITEAGWVAEIEVPIKTLRFKPGQSVWGLNVERRIKRLNETDRWAAARRDAWISNLAEAGRLEGIEDIRQGRGFDIRPYVSAGEQDRDGEMQAGLDLFKNLTPNLNASVTVNTDFAETEVDDRQVNLTRFPLFFPEKRAFFLEGAGVFDVAGLGGGWNVDLLPFFSRRIGLYRGGQVPILAGAKITGRQGRYNIGVLDVQTRRSDEAHLDGQNLLAARVSRNVFRQSWVGAIFTNGNPAGTGRNSLAGADARFATSTFRGDKNLALSLFVLRTDDEVEGADYAMGATVEYPNDLWNAFASAKQIGEQFQPALGFVPRRGIRKAESRVAFQPRPGRWGIRQLFLAVKPSIVTTLDSRVEDWAVETTPFNVRTESGDEFELSITPEYERLTEEFEISDGVEIQPGAYRWTRYTIEVATADRRPWVVESEIAWGGFYDGSIRQVEAGLDLKPSPHLAFGVEFERSAVSLAAGDFSTTVLGVKGDYAFSPNVSWANLVQYDSESRELGVQSRFRWILKPGNDLFFVLNRGWVRDLSGGYHRSFEKAAVKLQYTVRL